MAKEKTTKKSTASKSSAGKKAAAVSSAKVKTSKGQVSAKTAKKTDQSVVAAENEAAVKTAKAAEVKRKIAGAEKAAATENNPKSPASKLAKLHRWFGFIYLLQGLAVLVFARSLSAPLTLQYPSVDTLASDVAGSQVVAIANRHVADVQIAWVLAIMMIVFGAINIMASTAYRSYLDEAIKRNVNAFRWLALGVGGGLLVVTTALLSGISSIPMLVVLFGSVVAGALLTLGVEASVANNDGRKSRLAHFLCGLAALATLFPWLVFAIGVVGVMLFDGKLPGYLYSVYVCEALLAGAFMLATHYRLKRRGKWADNFYAERGYLLLTILAVTLLTWQIVAGAK